MILELRKLFKQDEFLEAYKWWVSMGNPQLLKKDIKKSSEGPIRDRMINIYGSIENFINFVNATIVMEACTEMETTIMYLCKELNLVARFYWLDKLYIASIANAIANDELVSFDEMDKDYKMIVPDLWIEIRDIQDDRWWAEFVAAFKEKVFTGYYANNTRNVFIKLAPRVTNDHIIRLVHVLMNCFKKK